MQAIVLVCDGCGVQVGLHGEFRNALEARAYAFNLGWRFPPLVNKDGSFHASSANDVCTRCLPNWLPQSREQKPKGGYRAVSGAVRRSR